jgi:hypothetical protein
MIIILISTADTIENATFKLDAQNLISKKEVKNQGNPDCILKKSLLKVATKNLWRESRMKKITVFMMLIAVCLALTGCDEKYTISSAVPDAENAIFTDSGRLFVTGGTNIYEIHPDGSKSALCEEGRYNFTGMAQVGNYLYAVATEYRFDCSPDSCGSLNIFSPTAVADFVNCIGDMLKDSVILCAEIVPGDLSFTNIYTIENTFIPNGMVADSAGRLYIADEVFLPIGKIVRLTLSSPISVASQETWLDPSDGLYSPNGMSIKGNAIYFSDFNLLGVQTSIKKVTINGDGSAGAISTVYDRIGFFDDLSAGTLFGTNVVVAADFVKGTLVFLKDNNKKQSSPIYETDCGMFDSPSAVIFGKGPHYTNEHLIITEKGIFFEHNSDVGNKVSGMLIE